MIESVTIRVAWALVRVIRFRSQAQLLDPGDVVVITDAASYTDFPYGVTFYPARLVSNPISDDGLRHRAKGIPPAEVDPADQTAGSKKFTWQVRLSCTGGSLLVERQW